MVTRHPLAMLVSHLRARTPTAEGADSSPAECPFESDRAHQVDRWAQSGHAAHMAIEHVHASASVYGCITVEDPTEACTCGAEKAKTAEQLVQQACFAEIQMRDRVRALMDGLPDEMLLEASAALAAWPNGAGSELAMLLKSEVHFRAMAVRARAHMAKGHSYYCWAHDGECPPGSHGD